MIIISDNYQKLLQNKVVFLHFRFPIQTSESSPIMKSVKKNMQDQTADIGISLVAAGYTRNANPGPGIQHKE